MAQPHTKKPSSIAVIAASPTHQATIANLLELYAHDFSEFMELSVGDDGRFGYKNLSAYWSEETHHPFLIERNGNTAGLVMVRRGSRVMRDPHVWDMAEFFVMRGHRRRGVGAIAAREIWRRFLGQWEVRVADRNQPALTFWRHTIGEFLGNPAIPTQFEENGSQWNLFAFEVRDRT